MELPLFLVGRIRCPPGTPAAGQVRWEVSTFSGCVALLRRQVQNVSRWAATLVLTIICNKVNNGREFRARSIRHSFRLFGEGVWIPNQQTARFFDNLYVASSNNCVLQESRYLKYSDKWPSAVIEPTGAVFRRKLIEDGQRQRSMYISHIGYCFDNSLEPPNCWKEPIPQKSLPTLATYVRKYCPKMLQGDFSQWDFLEKRIKELLHDYENCGYQIVEREGKYGLCYNRIPHRNRSTHQWR